MSFVTTVIVGNADKECARLGREAIVDAAGACWCAGGGRVAEVFMVLRRRDVGVHAEEAEEREEAGEDAREREEDADEEDMGTRARGGEGYETDKGRCRWPGTRVFKTPRTAVRHGVGRL